MSRQERDEISKLLADTFPTFGEWLPKFCKYYTWDWRHLLYIEGVLEQFYESPKAEKLMLFMPPRHGKSVLVTIHFSAYVLERNPGTRIIVGAYNQELAENFSRRTRRIVDYHHIPLSTEKKSSQEWETTQGGGLKAAGVGAGVTGHGAHLIIIDDPVKNREEANSKAYRDRVYDWYTNDLYTRREPGAKMILIQTRWHQDDLAGRILDSDEGKEWRVISFPAEAEEADVLGREEGEALCPERFTTEDLQGIKTAIGTWAYAALYQQNPLPPGGGLFQRDWFKIEEQSPSEDKVARRVRFWDKAATAAEGDFTSGCLMAATWEGDYWIEDITKGQWAPGQRDSIIRQTAEIDGLDVKVVIEEEGGASGKDMALSDKKLLMGFSVDTTPSLKSKLLRAESLAVAAEQGKVHLVRGRWVNQFLEEVATFPYGRNDDQVDSASGAFRDLVFGSNFLQWIRKQVQKQEEQTEQATPVQ